MSIGRAFEAKVCDLIARKCLLSKEDRHIVALSGGPDSVALLRVLADCGYVTEAAHCNFHLRGEESNRDEQFVKNLCENMDIPLHLIHFDTMAYAELHQVSIEMAARSLRYGYFEQLRTDIGAKEICVAHHRDDAVETLLMNLLRGAGLHGLTGIRPRNGHVVRPLLDVSRREIIKYLDFIGQDYVVDSSNGVPDVLRNKIRLQIIPLLEQISPMASAKIAFSANLLAEAEQIYNHSMESAKKNLFQHHNISISALLQEPSPQCLLYELLTPLGFTPDVIMQLYGSLRKAKTGSIFVSATHEALIDRGNILITERQEPVRPLVIPEPGIYVVSDQMKLRIDISSGASVSRNSNVATLDAGKVSFPLQLRTVQNGDRFVPYGMKGSKLVSDYLTDRRQPLTERHRQLTVTDSKGDIVWLVGQRTDNRFKIEDSTTETLTMTVF